MSHQVCAIFDEETALLRAAREVREGGWRIDDAFTPYAVHGLDDAMGIRRSRLGVVCFLFGLVGAVFMLWFQFWSSAVDWPINVGGKPYNSWPAFVPVMFEATILFAGLGVVGVLFVRCRLFPGRAPVMPPAAVTDDRFAMVVTVESEQQDPAELHRILEGAGATSIQDPVMLGEADGGDVA